MGGGGGKGGREEGRSKRVKGRSDQVKECGAVMASECAAIVPNRSLEHIVNTLRLVFSQPQGAIVPEDEAAREVGAAESVLRRLAETQQRARRRPFQPPFRQPFRQRGPRRRLGETGEVNRRSHGGWLTPLRKAPRLPRANRYAFSNDLPQPC
jgi:hypothetical protein